MVIWNLSRCGADLGLVSKVLRGVCLPLVGSFLAHSCGCPEQAALDHVSMSSTIVVAWSIFLACRRPSWAVCAPAPPRRPASRPIYISLAARHALITAPDCRVSLRGFHDAAGSAVVNSAKAPGFTVTFSGVNPIRSPSTISRAGCSVSNSI